jgi:sugar lactone lactonase YvrE
MLKAIHRRRLLVRALAVTAVVMSYAESSQAAGVPYQTGDVFAAIGRGVVKHFSPDGTLLDTLSYGTGTYDAGMAFDTSGNLYVTGFDSQNVYKFDPLGNLIGPFGSGYNTDPESILFDAAGNVYVGEADGSHAILKFSSAGEPAGSFLATTQDRGTDWIDLAADQCTIHYTSEGSEILRYNVCTNTELTPFVTGLQGPCYAHRIRPNGEELVACTTQVYHLDSTGAIIQTYSFAGTLFALNLDPDGNTFWTADLAGGTVYHVDIASGTLIKSFNAGINTALGGLAIRGEIVAAMPPPPPSPPSCALTAVIAGPPKQLQITVQSSNPGIQSVQVTESNNCDTVVPSFTPGVETALVVTATKIDQTQGAQVALSITDMSGQVTNCDPVVPGEPPVTKSASSALTGAQGGCNMGGMDASGYTTLLGAFGALSFLRRRRNAAKK